MNNIVSNIEEIRKKKGIKQEVLAEKLGISQPTYSGYLTRNKDLKYQQILDIADKLDVSVISIITYPDEYVLKEDRCADCKQRDITINSLNHYIKILEEKSHKNE